MSVFYASATLTVHLGDCLRVLPGLADASVHAVVTDPPYGMEFMGQDWDRFGRDIGQGYTEKPRWTSGHMSKGFGQLPNHFEAGPPFQRWSGRWAAECLRVLKPGGHLLAFGGTRTSHRLACAIEDAGFEIRDTIHWIYGQGFPKSLNVAKAISKTGSDPLQAREWEGWGTALKPAHEPIIVARKPLAGTVAANVTSHHCGGLHIDACRIPHGADVGLDELQRQLAGTAGMRQLGGSGYRPGHVQAKYSASGRWPANLLLCHAPDCADGAACGPGCPVAELDFQAGTRRSGANPVRRRSEVFATVYGKFPGNQICIPARGAQQGSAARFFPVFRYQPKASQAERPRLPGISHPTVKPLELMRWLVRLVAAPGITVLDPFAGTGSTLHACLLEGVHGIGIESDESYAELCAHRLRIATPGSPPARADHPGAARE